MIFYAKLVYHRKIYLKQKQGKRSKKEEMTIKNLYFILKAFVLTGVDLAL